MQDYHLFILVILLGPIVTCLYLGFLLFVSNRVKNLFENAEKLDELTGPPRKYFERRNFSKEAVVMSFEKKKRGLQRMNLISKYLLILMCISATFRVVSCLLTFFLPEKNIEFDAYRDPIQLLCFVVSIEFYWFSRKGAAITGDIIKAVQKLS